MLPDSSAARSGMILPRSLKKVKTLLDIHVAFATQLVSRKRIRWLAQILCMILQLRSYHIAVRCWYVDQPRNLAKSVTVE
jgi:glucosamine 6-phosphate synthetase-like amidotransferase/phosphosugar isomerase protein